MMYAINGGQVASYYKGQRELVYLALKLQNVAEAGQNFVFTDRRAATGYAAFYTDLADLREIDWDLVHERQWDNIPEYPDRKERKQAEFLVHEFVPWDLVEVLAVMTPRIKQRVEALFAAHPPSSRRPVLVRRRWYY